MKAAFFAGLCALCLGSSFAQAGQADLKAARLTKKSMNRIVFALEQYRRLCGSVPTTEQGLATLEAPGSCGSRAWGALLKPVGRDAWGRAFVYESDGKTYKLMSYGRDGKEGGTGEEMDLLAQ